MVDSLAGSLGWLADWLSLLGTRKPNPTSEDIQNTLTQKLMHSRRSKLEGLDTWRVLPPNNTEMIHADHLAKAVPHPKVRIQE